MSRLLNFFLGEDNRHKCADFGDPAALFEGLQQEKNEAICCLYSKIAPSVIGIGKSYQLADEEIEELIGDCIALLLLKIRTAQYVFQGYDPATYVIEVAKNKVRHFKKKTALELTNLIEPPVEPDYGSLESVYLLEHLLAQLPKNCQKLIRLKYLDEIRDKQVIEQQLTQYTTVDALKNHRAQCMKKLISLGLASQQKK